MFDWCITNKIDMWNVNVVLTLEVSSTKTSNLLITMDRYSKFNGSQSGRLQIDGYTEDMGFKSFLNLFCKLGKWFLSLNVTCNFRSNNYRVEKFIRKRARMYFGIDVHRSINDYRSRNAKKKYNRVTIFSIYESQPNFGPQIILSKLPKN